jgi:ribosomal protein S17E
VGLANVSADQVKEISFSMITKYHHRLSSTFFKFKNNSHSLKNILKLSPKQKAKGRKQMKTEDCSSLIMGSD